jgi:hypothetical protein
MARKLKAPCKAAQPRRTRLEVAGETTCSRDPIEFRLASPAKLN